MAGIPGKHESRSGAHFYLLGRFVIGDVGLDTEGPFHVQLVFVKLEEKDDQDEEGVDHKERENAAVAQVLQIFGNSRLQRVFDGATKGQGRV